VPVARAGSGARVTSAPDGRRHARPHCRPAQPQFGSIQNVPAFVTEYLAAQHAAVKGVHALIEAAHLLAMGAITALACAVVCARMTASICGKKPPAATSASICWRLRRFLRVCSTVAGDPSDARRNPSASRLAARCFAAL